MANTGISIGDKAASIGNIAAFIPTNPATRLGISVAFMNIPNVLNAVPNIENALRNPPPTAPLAEARAEIVLGINVVSINPLNNKNVFLRKLNPLISAPPTELIIDLRELIIVGINVPVINTLKALNLATKNLIGFINVPPSAFIFSLKDVNISLTNVPFMNLENFLTAVTTLYNPLNILPSLATNTTPNSKVILPKCSFILASPPANPPVANPLITSAMLLTTFKTALTALANASGFNTRVAKPAIPAKNPPVSFTAPKPFSNELFMLIRIELASSCFLMASRFSSSDLTPA